MYIVFLCLSQRKMMIKKCKLILKSIQYCSNMSKNELEYGIFDS